MLLSCQHTLCWPMATPVFIGDLDPELSDVACLKQAKLKNRIYQKLSELQSEFCSWHPFLLKTPNAGTMNFFVVIEAVSLKLKWLLGTTGLTENALVQAWWDDVRWCHPVFFFYPNCCCSKMTSNLVTTLPKQGIWEQKYKFLMVHYLFCWSATCPNNLSHNSEQWRDKFQQSACFVGGSFSPF